MVSLEQLEAIPIYHQDVISEEHLDVMGHMNVRWYMALFDAAAWKFFSSFGMHEGYFREENAGGFALKQFIQYLAEVQAGQKVAIRTRMLGRSAKRIHFIHFMINETTIKLAATLEGLGAHADLSLRRTTPFPAHIAKQIDAILHKQRQLEWESPICGVIKP